MAVAFLDDFLSRFTPEQRDSQIVKLFSSFGVNTEMAIKEELDKELREFTELVAFSENRLRSWLCSFFMRVRVNTSAHASGKLMMSKMTSDVNIPAGTMVKTASGVKYMMTRALYFNRQDVGVARTVDFLQGQPSSTSGSYTGLITFPVQDIDLGEYDSSFQGEVQSGIRAGVKVFAFYADFGAGMVEVPEVSQVNSSDESVYFFQPSDGYYAYYHSGLLFVKLFAGAHVPLSGHAISYRIDYWTCSGAQGNNPVNSIKEFDQALLDINGDPVSSYVFTNEEIGGGANAPSKYELVNLLRKRFFVRTSVASVPEYTIWLLAQPEVGDCMVIGDYEKWLKGRVVKNNVVTPSASGVQPYSEEGFDLGDGTHRPYEFGDRCSYLGYIFQALATVPTGPWVSTYWFQVGESLGSIAVTGRVDLYLMDKDAQPLSRGATESLLQRLEEVKDIAVINFMDFGKFFHYYLVEYEAAADDVLFREQVRAVINNYYSIGYLRAQNLSLFDDLDINNLDRGILDLPMSHSGVKVHPYHFMQVRVPADDTAQLVFNYYTGDVVGGFYRRYKFDQLIVDEATGMMVPIDPLAPPTNVLKEYALPGGRGKIYTDDQTAQEVGEISEGPGNQVIINTSLWVGAAVDPLRENDYFFCYFKIGEEGVAPVGGSNGARYFWDVEFQRPTTA